MKYLICLLFCMTCLSAARPVKVLLLTGSSDEPYHDWRETSACLRNILLQSGQFEIWTNEQPTTLSAAELLRYDLVIINYNGPRWPTATESAIEAFVRQGKGLLSLHHASYGSFFGHELRDGKWQSGPPGSGWTAFAEMIGACWDPRKLGHARRGVFPAEWQKINHAITNDLPSPFTINDEIYHRLDLSADVQVLAVAHSPAELGGTGRQEPIIWTHAYGQGRVFFTTLGHDAMAFYQPGMINAIARGAEWAATGQVTLSPIDPHRSKPTLNAVRLLVVTGGHGYPVSFYHMLDQLENVTWTHAVSHQQTFADPLEKKYDVVLLHDMYEQTSQLTRARLQSFVKAGKGVVSSHHAIVDYTDWPWWYQEVTGGKYFTSATEQQPASQYKEDVEFTVTPHPDAMDHPVLRGVGELVVFDELYRGMWISPKVKVLMETHHPDNDRPVVYIGPFQNARVIYIQLGHSEHTMKHPGFQRLMNNAVQWAAGRI